MSIHYSFYVEDAALLDRLAQEQGLAEDLGPAGAVSLDVRIDAHGENPPTTIVLTLAKRDVERVAPPWPRMGELLSLMDDVREVIRRETGVGSVPAGVRMHVVEPPNAIDTPMADITLHLQQAASRLSVVASEGRLVPWLKGRLEEARSDIANAMEVAERSMATSRQLQVDNNALRQQVETLKAAAGEPRKQRNHGDHTCEEWEKATSERIAMLNTVNNSLKRQLQDSTRECSERVTAAISRETAAQTATKDERASVDRMHTSLISVLESVRTRLCAYEYQVGSSVFTDIDSVIGSLMPPVRAQAEVNASRASMLWQLGRKRAMHVHGVDMAKPGDDFTVVGFTRYYPAVEMVDSTCDIGVRGVMKEAAAGEWFARDEVVARVQEWAKIMGHMAAVNSKLLNATRIDGLDNLMWVTDKSAAKVNDAWESAQCGPLLRDEDRGMVTFSHLTAKEVEHLPVREWHAWRRRLTIHIEVSPTSEGPGLLFTPFVSTALRRYVRAIDGGAMGMNARERLAFDFEGKQVMLVALVPVQP